MENLIKCTLTRFLIVNPPMWIARSLKSHYKQPICFNNGAAMLGVPKDDTPAIFNSIKQISWIKIPPRKLETNEFQILWKIL